MMHKEVRFSTLNVRGLTSKEKVLCLKDFLDFNKIDICFLQETHITKMGDLEYLNECLNNYDIRTMLTDSRSRGVAILVKKIEHLKVNFIEYDLENRVFCVNANIFNRSFNLINIYAPNLYQEQNVFIEKLYEIINSKKNIILAGDFNCVVSKNDRNNANNENIQDKKHEKNWKDLYKHLNLIEIENKNESDEINKQMTWTNGSQSSRIDRIYMKKDLNVSIKYVNNQFFSMSDHRMIVAEIDLNEKIKTKRIDTSWKLNESLLDYQDVNDKIIEFCNQIPRLIRKHGMVWYDVFINFVISYLKIIGREKAKEKKEEINKLFEDLNNLDKFDDLSQEHQNNKNIIIEKIDEFYKLKKKGIEKRVCDERMSFIKQPTKCLINKEVNKNKNCMIEQYRLENDEITENKEAILKNVCDFYQNLLGKDRVDDENLNNYEFKMKSMNEIENNIDLNSNISFEEAYKVVKEMNESAPGPNGLTIGFYKKYFPYFGHYFINILNSDECELPETFNVSLIKLIPKNQNKIKGVNDLRPISLTNFEYRILTKILSNRMRLIGYKIIGEHQTCSILGRRINDNINMIRDMIDDACLRRLLLYLITVDQRKAFDSISHKYLYKLLKHMNFGDFIFNSIKRIYDNSYAVIEVNRIKSEKFKINSGIKQGCALSMFLYVLAIEELLVCINQNKNIKGYNVNVISKNEIKTSAYADDVVGLVTSEKSIKEFFESFKAWGKVSGASMNEDKTQILAVNANFESKYKLVNELKILGVIFNDKGISKINLEKTRGKLEQTLCIWNGANLNTIERIVACKTFALSKLWYISSFMDIPEIYIKKYESIIYKFIWNGNIEYIKRNTLNLPFDRGGLGMFNIRAKFETIHFQQFKYIVWNYNKCAYQLSVYWLKFHMKELKLKNFNIIPSGSEKDRPVFYNNIIYSLNKIKHNDKTFINKLKSYSSKKTYEILVEDKYIKPKIESLPLAVNWNDVYSKIHKNLYNSEMRTVNYKILMDALPLNYRIFKNKTKCFYCNRHDEERDHLFTKCEEVRKLFEIASQNLEVKRSLSFRCIILHENQNEKDFVKVCYFKFLIWRIRNILRVKNQVNIELLFRKFWNKWLISITDT
jgi:endonuclease/exonuclease/phosphatase family metal-dependent hydrolase